MNCVTFFYPEYVKVTEKKSVFLKRLKNFNTGSAAEDFEIFTLFAYFVLFKQNYIYVFVSFPPLF